MKPKYNFKNVFDGGALAAFDRKCSFPRLLSIGFGLVVAGFSSQSALADYVWTGNAGNGLYSDAGNWTGTNTENNVIDNGDTVTVDRDISWNTNDLWIGANGGSLTNPTSGTVTISSGSLNTNFWTFVGDWAGEGTLNITGSGSYTSGAADGNGTMLVGLYGSTGVLNVNTTGTLTASGLYVAPNNTTNGGALPDSGGTFNLDAGTVNISGDTQIGSDFFAAGDYSNGKMNMTGGTMNVGGVFEVGHHGLSVTSGESSATISGGVLNVENDLKIGHAGNTGVKSSLIIDGGEVNVASDNTRWLILGVWDSSDVNMEISNGGSLNLNAGTNIMFGTGNNSGVRTLTVDGGTLNGTADGGSHINMQLETTGGSSVITIQNGGLVAVDAILGGDVSTLNFDGGTLKATKSDPNLINIGGAGTTNLLAGGATIDTNGYDPTIASSLDGVGGLTKIGEGHLTLAENHTYTGDTLVSAGTLFINGELGATNVTVEAGASIGAGDMGGTLGGDLSFEAGAKLDITVGILTVGSGSTVSFGGFGFSDIVGFDAQTAQNGIYTLIGGDFTLDSSNIEHFGFDNKLALPGDERYAYFEEGSLNVVIIPEPTVALLSSVGMLCLLRRRRTH